MHILVRLIGFADDGEDYYYVTKDIRGKVVWESMVGAIIPLKGRISNWNYHNIERQFDGWKGYVSQCPKERDFISIYSPTEHSLEMNILYPDE